MRRRGHPRERNELSANPGRDQCLDHRVMMKIDVLDLVTDQQGACLAPIVEEMVLVIEGRSPAIVAHTGEHRYVEDIMKVAIGD